MQNQRNLLLAVALSFLLLIGWDTAMGYLYPAPPQSEQATEQTAQQGAATDASGAATTSASGEIPASGEGAGLTEAGPVDLAQSLEGAERVRIEAPLLTGSINLATGAIDDIELKEYRETTDDDSEQVRLFAPQGTQHQQFAQFGFLLNGVRQEGAAWQASAETLSPGNPVTLTRADEAGLTTSITLSIDDQYMISAEQRVANTGEAAAVAQPFALISRSSRNASEDLWLAHSGPIGVFADAANYDYGYEDVEEAGTVTPDGDAAWIGFTDIYWLSALVPENGTSASANFRSLGNEQYRSDVIYDAITLPAGQAVTRTTQLFVGAKESTVLDQYEDAGIARFGLAIDWGWFRWFEKPMLWLLNKFYDFAGNFGVAIILLTLVVRLLLFPIAQKQFASMAGMKAVQPRMKAIQDKYKDDKVKAQQEMQKLFKEEGVNPLAGCLPLIVQIPIFFALYKVLYLAIEMRHRPFLWIDDLSAPDPAKILNLFGLLPFDPPSFLGIGVLAVGLGVTMWLTFKLNPSAMDPVQQQIFNIMPWVLMFVMAPFAAGLLVYWNVSNILTLAQQKYLYSKHPQLKAAAEKEKAEKAREAAAKAKG
ncbi:membrane protein insertase YidC [Qipengyuania sp. DGS5-3]|uniref:membrane protein insertase YidC n=1 Tax=Qipengyuania sp. DGS5-3 TaxID=3349632 RepID=UPI0036D25CEA